MKFKLDMRYASNCARDLIATNSRSLLIASACFVVGTAIGVAVAVKIEDYSALNLLEALKLGEYSASGAFFKCLALGVIGAALAYLTAFKRQLAALSALWSVYLGYRFGGATSGCRLAKNAAMTCRKPLTDALIKTAILLGAYMLVLIVFCVILPKLIALLFL